MVIVSPRFDDPPVKAEYPMAGNITDAIRERGRRLITELHLFRMKRALARNERIARALGKPPEVECSVCGWSGEAFIPVRTGHSVIRTGVRCPNCRSNERHRLIKLTLDSLEFTQWEGRLLHTAPQTCLRHVLGGVAGLEYITVDLAVEGVDCNIDLQALPFADDSLDYVCSSHVLEHVPDDRLALSEIRRVLREGGIALICVPYDPDMAQTVEFGGPDPANYDHVRSYGRDMVDRAAEYFAVTDYSTDQWPAPHVLRYRLWRNDMLLALT
jgi:hypothetical protein